VRQGFNFFLRQHGYSLSWTPPCVLAQGRRLIEIDFSILAAHLMLRIKRPYFIGIGANDGVTHDPLFPFVRDFGWQGIMVEPLPQAFASLEKNYANYKDVDLVQAAVSRSDGTGIIYTVETSSDNSMSMSLYSSFSKDILLRGKTWHPKLEEHIITQSVPLMSIDTLLAMTKGRAVDVLKIDTEGHDLEILKSVNFSKMSPSLILAEQANLSRNDKIRMADILLRQDYNVAMTSLDMLGYKPTSRSH